MHAAVPPFVLGLAQTPEAPLVEELDLCEEAACMGSRKTIQINEIAQQDSLKPPI